MYLALFLAPWMLGYAVSTLAMNHRMPRPTSFVTERDQPYPNVFEPGTPPREIARQILADLELDGAFGVQGPSPDVAGRPLDDTKRSVGGRGAHDISSSSAFNREATASRVAR